MPRVKVQALDRLADRRAARKKARERKHALLAPERRRRRVKMMKVVAVVALLAVFTLLGFAVGTSDYEVTLIGWVPLLMTVMGLVLAYVYALVLYHGITFEEETAANECTRDSEVAYTVRFTNRTPLLATRVRLYLFISDMFDNVANQIETSIALTPFETYPMSLMTRFEHIGRYHAGIERVVISDFIGLFTFTIENPSRHVIQVIPKVLELGGIRISDEAMDEATKAAKSVLADSMDYAYVREYEQGDPLKTIHWKLSARSNQYMTRLYEVYSNPSVVIVMDFYAPSDEAADLMSMFDAVVESAFSLARFARLQGMDVEMRYRNRHGQDRCLTDIRKSSLADLVEDLPAMSNDYADAAAALDILSRLTQATHGSNNLYVCTANVGAEMVSSVLEAKLRRRSPMMTAVVPPGLMGREREDYCAALGRLESADVPYAIIARADELVKAGDA